MKYLSIAVILLATGSAMAEIKEPKPASPAPEIKQLDAAQRYAVEQALSAAQNAQKLLSDVVQSVEKQCGGKVQPSPNGIVCVVQPKAETPGKK